MVECAGSHIQPRLFRPVADEVLCADCRQARAETVAEAQIAARGADAVRAALRRGVLRDVGPCGRWHQGGAS